MSASPPSVPDSGNVSAGATRAGFVAVLGAPNAGKSTLVNALVGAKVSIVTPKAQTTRARVLGIAMRDLEGGARAQIVFVDTPGIFAAGKRRLERAMVAAAWKGAEDADAVLLTIDAARGLTEEARAIMARLAGHPKPRAIVLNKIDLVRRDLLLALAAEANALLPSERVFMVSALAGDGVDDIAAWCAAAAPAGPFLFPEDELGDMPLRLLAAEIVREQVFLQLHDELPYQIAVETDEFQERADGSARIEQTVYVMRESQRKIVLGEAGRRIKTIGSRARAELETQLERKVHLFLHVKVRDSWDEDRERFRRMGLEFDV